MIRNHLSACAAVLLVGVAPASAQLNFQHHPTKDPYRSLFAGPSAARTSPPSKIRLAIEPRASTPPRPVVACGMLVVPADPAVDPRIRVGPREDGVGHTMRVIPTPPCEPGA